MAAARPTIFAGNSHNNPIAEASAGITVAPEDSRAIATAVKTLAAMSSDERWKMGLRAWRYIEEHHDFTGLASRLERVLQSALTLPEHVKNETPTLDVEHTDTFKVENVHTQ